MKSNFILQIEGRSSKGKNTKSCKCLKQPDLLGLLRLAMQLEAINSRVRVPMINPQNRLFCRLDGLTPAAREQQRILALENLGLLEVETVPVFDEATQTAANFIEAPICILGLMVQDRLWLKSAVGLSRIGLMNQLAVSRSIPRQEAFSTYVVDGNQNLIIEDTISNPVFASSALVQDYGIRAYLGTPLITAPGQCIGTLALMDLEPRKFTNRDIQFLAMTARWCLREFERDRLLKTKQIQLRQQSLEDRGSQEWKASSSHREADLFEIAPPHTQKTSPSSSGLSTNTIVTRLLEQLTQKFRTPLTSVIGMASVLKSVVYGPLTNKQKEYMDIIHTSGQYLISLAEEIVNLGGMDRDSTQLKLNPTEIEMLCQQVLNNLVQIAKQQRQELRLSVEPGHHIWLLDKEKVRQILYYLAIGTIESAQSGSEIHIHVSHRSKTLNISIWATHPWLEDGLPQVELYNSSSVNNLQPLDLKTGSERVSNLQGNDYILSDRVLSSSELAIALKEKEQQQDNGADKNYRKLLGLLLACHLTEIHEGQVVIQGAPESGYRYVLQLPKKIAEQA